MPKWDKAIYQTSNKTWVTVYPEELYNPAFRAFLRTQQLWDFNERNRLRIRYRLDTPHFYSPSKTMKLLESRGENSTRHNNRVAELLSLFQKQDLLFGHRRFDTEEQVLVPLFKSEKYAWAKEVTRTMSGGELQWRHDLFGGHSLHKHTKLSPWVAVEVIDSHFPSDTALDAWLETSSEFPYFVLFDFVQKKNYFLKVDEEKKQVRVVYFIFDGAVWRSGKQWEGCTAASFREELSERIARG